MKEGIVVALNHLDSPAIFGKSTTDRREAASPMNAI